MGWRAERGWSGDQRFVDGADALESFPDGVGFRVEVAHHRAKQVDRADRGVVSCHSTVATYVDPTLSYRADPRACSFQAYRSRR